MNGPYLPLTLIDVEQAFEQIMSQSIFGISSGLVCTVFTISTSHLPVSAGLPHGQAYFQNGFHGIPPGGCFEPV